MGVGTSRQRPSSCEKKTRIRSSCWRSSLLIRLVLSTEWFGLFPIFLLPHASILVLSDTALADDFTRRKPTSHVHVASFQSRVSFVTTYGGV